MSDLIAKLMKLARRDLSQARSRAHFAVCQSKMLFLTKAKANDHIKRSVRKGGDPRLQAYHCPVCRFFHVKTKLRRKSRS